MIPQYLPVSRECSRSSRLPGSNISKCGNREKGYVLLVLLLSVTLLSIGFMAVCEQQMFQLKRDREEELIHRGVQYSRAVRRFVKKFGRYPDDISELENTNNIRFLRKRYTDPITGKDFKILHVGDIFAAANVVPPSTPPENGSRTSLQGEGNTSDPGTADDPAQNDNNTGADATTTAEDQDNGNSENVQSKSSSTTSVTAGSPATTAQKNTAPQGAQLFTGGAMIGVVSASTARTIREFNKKNHYNEWRFFYSPNIDSGALLNGPTQAPLQNAVSPNQ